MSTLLRTGKKQESKPVKGNNLAELKASAVKRHTELLIDTFDYYAKIDDKENLLADEATFEQVMGGPEGAKAKLIAKLKEVKPAVANEEELK